MNNTERLNLQKYDTIQDSKEPFSIDKALNTNWDIIDSCVWDLQTKNEQLNNNLQDLQNTFENKLDTVHVNYSKGQRITVKQYYCPSDGVVTGVMTAAHSEKYYLQVNGNNVLYQFGETNQRVTGPFCVPVKQNDCISDTYSRLNNYKFFPYY